MLQLVFLVSFLVFGIPPLYPQSAEELYMAAISDKENGDFLLAEKKLLKILEQKNKISLPQLVGVYNELGIINSRLGRYDLSVTYYRLGEDISLKNIGTMQYKLPTIYNNLGNIFKYKGDYEKSLLYYNESLKNTDAKGLEPEEKNTSLAHAYSNMGIVYYLKKDYQKANTYFEKGIAIRKKYHIKGLDIVYNNYANSLRELHQFETAGFYYQECIRYITGTYGKDYYRLAYVYADMGKLKQKTGDGQAGLYLYHKALDISLAYYGKKHPYTAEMHQIIGDYYANQNEFEKALACYQQSLIANCKYFNSADIYKNPDKLPVLSELQLLTTFKKKADVLLMQTDKPNDEKGEGQKLKLGIETIELALAVLQNVRQAYISTESKLFITENEKTFYLSAIEYALRLYELSGNKNYIEKAYNFSRSAKAAVLLDEIKQNGTFASVLPVDIKNKKDGLSQNMASFKKLIFDENGKKEPDQLKISRWQSELFQLNVSYELIIKNINRAYPNYPKLMAKTKVPSLQEISAQLLPDETLIEYSYQPNNNKGLLYTFVLDNNGLKYYRQQIDSSFEQTIDFCRQKMDLGSHAFPNIEEYNRYNQKLYWLYNILVEPALSANSKKFIVVPDEKIANVSFDALVSDYKKGDQINYAGLKYLVYDYTFSYAYSSNLITEQDFSSGKSSRVYAFAPAYHSTNQVVSRNLFGELKNAETEIGTILKYFKGEAFTGDMATKSSFESSLAHNGIYHLAMHANSLNENPEYSYLAFSQTPGSKKDACLYNYEIGKMPINASMVVLSACNTGDGKIYSGEGVMSLSRGFFLAGIPAVVHGLWKVNDESSSVIMGSFYKHLSEGKPKNEALRLAKIEYIENSSPEFANPAFWSGIVLMGDRLPVVKTDWLLVFVLMGIGVLIVLGIVYRRRIFGLIL